MPVSRVNRNNNEQIKLIPQIILFICSTEKDSLNRVVNRAINKAMEKDEKRDILHLQKLQNHNRINILFDKI